MAIASARRPANLTLRLRRYVVVGAALLLLLGLCFKASVRGDGIGYYAYLPAVVGHGTVNMKPTFDDFLAAGVPAYASNLEIRLPNGLTANYKQVGSAVMALPFYLVALLLLRLTVPGADLALHPMAQFAFTAAALFYALVALLLIYRFARRLWGGWSSGLALAAAVFATPLVAYLLFEPSYNHAFSMAAITFFALLLYQTGPDRRGWQWLVLGAIGGVMSITHVQEALFMALVPAEAMWLILGKRWSPRFIPGYALLGLGFIAGIAPQIAIDRAIFNRWLPPSAGNIGFTFAHPHLLDLLFSTHHGWLSWSPLVIVAFFGFPLLVRRLGWFAIALIAIFLGEVVVNGALTDWWGGLGFGARRLTDETLLLVLAYAALFDWMRSRIPALAVGLVAAGIAWTVALLAQYYYIIKIDIGPPWRDFLLGQLRAIRYVPHLFVQGAVVRDLASHDWLGAVLTTLGLAAVLVLAASLALRLALPFDRAPRTSSDDLLDLRRDSAPHTSRLPAR